MQRKDSLKLVRDSQGNWSYQYETNEEELEEKQDAAMQKQIELRDFIKEQNSKALEDFVSLTQEFKEKVLQIQEDYLNGLYKNEEEFLKDRDVLIASYYGDNGLITMAKRAASATAEDLNKATAETDFVLYSSDPESYAEMLEEEQAILDDFIAGRVNSYFNLEKYISQFYDNIQLKGEKANKKMLNTWNSAAAEMIKTWNGEGDESIKSQLNMVFEEINTLTETYATKRDAGLTAIGMDYNDITKEIKALSNETETLKSATSDLVTTSNNLLTSIKSVVNEVGKIWDNSKNQVTSALSSAVSGLGIAGNAMTALSDTTSYACNSVVSNLQKVSNQATATGNAIRSAFVSSTGSGIQIGISMFNSLASKKSGGVITSAKTGMYTGTWSGSGNPDVEDGKLAWLHEKELVLNKDDTSKILDTVNIVRNLENGLTRKLYNLTNKIVATTVSSSPIVNNESSVVGDTIFNVEASFPNANSVTDIQEAFLSLGNYATQHAWSY